MPDSSTVPLSDMLGTYRSISSFFAICRLDPTVAALLASQSSSTTVLAPRNSAFDRMPRKPWEDARDYATYGPNAYDSSCNPDSSKQQPSTSSSPNSNSPSSPASESDGKRRADANLVRFVKAHLIPQTSWPRGARVATLAGRQVWWDWAPDTDAHEDRPRVIMPDGVRVQSVTSPVANGQVWILDDVLQVP
ncbi:hypothetical protein CDD81_1546 [Ophiocordyceps australis]|uniref:FAS1 domain-containing protein n=1 Tax=Ophiocordyceps australis TaxID=1399860 RepID=A0A2C5Y0S8_9HYPO|nr:hypothetical protein CDD81_1546 [Ophiocordyceps australis]